MTELADTLLVEHLRIQRRAGFGFGEAWPVALEALEPTLPRRMREDWMEALLKTESGWEEAYERQPSRLTELEPSEGDESPRDAAGSATTVLRPGDGSWRRSSSG